MNQQQNNKRTIKLKASDKYRKRKSANDCLRDRPRVCDCRPSSERRRVCCRKNAAKNGNTTKLTDKKKENKIKNWKMNKNLAPKLQ